MQQTKTNGLKIILAAITLPLGGIFARAMEPQMIEIPQGQLHREDQTNLTIKPWRLADKELTWREYSAVRAWAVKHGYDLGPGNAQGPDFPASTLS